MDTDSLSQPPFEKCMIDANHLDSGGHYDNMDRSFDNISYAAAKIVEFPHNLRNWQKVCLSLLCFHLHIIIISMMLPNHRTLNEL